MRNLTFAEIALEAGASDHDAALGMDDEAFRGFYERTARIVWMYLAHGAGNAALADDLLQETYYRFLRADRQFDGDAHRRNYLFRIATNLLRDERRRRRIVDFVRVPGEDEPNALFVVDNVDDAAARRTDLSRAMAHLKPNDRALLWLAYGQGLSHDEIAETLGLSAVRVKSRLFRARRRLAALLTGGQT
jgi:RNA polymerase sigma-70 factor (ECF subfamily)